MNKTEAEWEAEFAQVAHLSTQNTTVREVTAVQMGHGDNCGDVIAEVCGDMARPPSGLDAYPLDALDPLASHHPGD